MMPKLEVIWQWKNGLFLIFWMKLHHHKIALTIFFLLGKILFWVFGWSILIIHEFEWCFFCFNLVELFINITPSIIKVDFWEKNFRRQLFYIQKEGFSVNIADWKTNPSANSIMCPISRCTCFYCCFCSFCYIDMIIIGASWRFVPEKSSVLRL